MGGEQMPIRVTGPQTEEESMHAQTMTRRAFVMLGAMALATGLFGCGSKPEPEPETEPDGEAITPTEEPDSTPVSGGWETNADAPTSALTADQQAVFDQAIENYDGMDLLPACVLATQVVAGTNYAFLCQGTSVTANPETGWYVVVVYENLEGACEASSVEQINVSEPALVAGAQDGEDAVVGGWAVVPQVTDDPIAIPEKAASAFAACDESAGLSPLALLATQLVAGTNYRILCVGAPAVPDAQGELNVVDVYEDLEGKAECASIEPFDLLTYV